MKSYGLKLVNVKTGETKYFKNATEGLKLLNVSHIDAMMAYKNNYPIAGYHVFKTEKISEFSIKLNTPVKNVTTGKKFDNMYKAAHYYRKKNPYDILYAIENGKKTVGCIWEYAKMPDMSLLSEKLKEDLNKNKQKRTRVYKQPVINLTTGKTYDTTKEAIKDLGISNGTMYSMLQGKIDSWKGHKVRILSECKFVNKETDQVITSASDMKDTSNEAINQANKKEDKMYNVSLENAALFFGIEPKDLIKIIESEYGEEHEDFKPIYKVESFEMTKEGFDKIFNYINTL